MAKILVDQGMINLMPDFIDQVRDLVGNIKIKQSLVIGTNEICFDSPLYAENEVVLARVSDAMLDKKSRVISINSTENSFTNYT